ncbi:MAG: T9SS type A sorting domain-containing protein [Chitinophagales bacterium]
MKTTLTVSIILLLICSVCSAQQDVQKIISYNKTLFATDLKVDNAGNIVCSFNDDPYNVSKPGIMKLDSSLNIIWATEQQFSSDTGQFQSTSQQLFDITPDNGIVAISNATDVYSHGIISRIDSTGNLLWSRIAHYNNYSNLLSAVASMPSGNFLVCGYEYPYTAILKIDNEGNLLWKEKLTFGDYNIGNQIIRAHDGNYFISGYGADNSPLYGLVMKIDSNGQLLWANKFSTGESCFILSFVEGNDSSYYFNLVGSDTILIAKALENGDVLFTNTYYQSSSGLNQNSLSLSSDGNLLVSGDDGTTYNPWLLEFSQTDGSLYSSFQFATGYSQLFSHITTLPGGSVALVGMEVSTYDSIMLYFIKGALTSGTSCNEENYNNGTPSLLTLTGSAINVTVDSSSYALDTINFLNTFIEPVTSVKCISTGVEAIDDVVSFSVFPNPATDLVHLKLNDASTHFLAIKIFDLAGRKVFEEENFYRHSIAIYCDHFGKGIFIIQAFSENGMAFHKLVIE